MVLDIISTGPVKLVDVRDTLNAFGGEANNDCVSFFQNNDANKWAKYKDVKYYADFPPYDGEWWKADDGCCGFDKDSILFNSVDELIEAYDNNATYIYEPPVGGTSEPLRLGDFRGHAYQAAAPIWDFYVYREFVQNDEDSYIECQLLSNHSGINSQYNLVLGDITNMADDISEWYFGCIIVNGDGQVFAKSHEESIGSNAEITNNRFEITYSELEFTPNNYTIYPCLCEFRPQQGKTGRVMAVPCAANKDAGGNFIPSNPRDPVIETPAVGWVDVIYWYRGSRGFMFKSTIAYLSTLDGGQASVKVELYTGEELSLTEEINIDLNYTEIHSEKTYYMDFEWDSRIPDAMYTRAVLTVVGGSNMIEDRQEAQDYRDKELPFDTV